MNKGWMGLEDHLSKFVLDWVLKSVNPQASVVSVQRLPGSTSSRIYCISLCNERNIEKYVLRQIDDREWLHEEPDLAYHEAESLRLALHLDIKTPEIIAWDETGSSCGVPSVLMTKLDGDVELIPKCMDNWLNGLAETLSTIHMLEGVDSPWNYYTYNDISSFDIPTWSDYPDAWGEAIRIVRGFRPEEKLCFIHRDYHPANVLWSQNKVGGVVDWVNACLGPAGVDVGHCRLNLAQLFDVATADHFLTAYQHYAGSAFRYDSYWDLVSLIDILFGPPTVYPGWAAFGVTGLTDEMMKERLDAYLLSILRKI
ncbi:phosphotransferase family protein [Peribacillus sp. NPDC096379]|uniref:phosphotransferase family protein n=1 Tax=Peribacillus sp. NPDC096379 TaxID=3364393 RepID=UPI0037FB4917